ncbi:MAG: fibronectin type III domain-containing protein [Pseudomonadota bacterium]|nr:fibronectin type III domain-containing protein [Pseudomonadota bacterium]
MKRVIKMSKAWSAAFLLGLSVVLSGCGGGGGGSSSAGVGASSGQAGGGSQTGSQQVGDGSGYAVLSWTAPSTRVNGEGIKMGELDQYVIRFGQDPEDLGQQVTVDGAESFVDMSYTINGLEEGTWYFTIQVKDAQGLISEPSAPVSKTIS